MAMKPNRTPPRAKPGLKNFGRQPDIGSDRVDDTTSVGVNNADMYLEKVHMKAKHEVGEEKGKVMNGNYGSREDTDNQIYSDRGMKDPDMSKLNKQNLPNTRMYSYVQ
jgi:hypothetical protein